jgi:hypothetical protein
MNRKWIIIGALAGLLTVILIRILLKLKPNSEPIIILLILIYSIIMLIAYALTKMKKK